VDAISERIVCPCGCGDKIVAKCYCGVADGFRAEILAQIETGSTDAQVIEYFVAKYGERILAAPPASGFNWAAWIVPGAALLLGAGVAIGLLRRWSRASRAAAPAGASGRATAAESTDPYARLLDAELASRKD
jgi:cytochrome c-type biogenesis protein CcmH